MSTLTNPITANKIKAMKQLLTHFKKYLNDRKDYDGSFNDLDLTYSGNREAKLLDTIEFLEDLEDDDMWHEILEYCEDKGLTEWAQQIENYFINTSIG